MRLAMGMSSRDGDDRLVYMKQIGVQGVLMAPALILKRGIMTTQI